MGRIKSAVTLGILMSHCMAMAGDFGFLYRGKEYITFRDGKKMGPSAAEVLKQNEKDEDSSALHQGRIPASNASDITSSSVIFFQRQGGHTCFFLANHSGVSCIQD